jgi:2-dehydro-3-deoxyphosphogluconate aldolase/(4S)-4-hydroxy-2-oxoglutarate aldolase
MQDAFPTSLSQRIEKTGIIAVLVIENAGQAVPLARALLAGGIEAMELTLRTPVALEALRRIRSEVPEMIVGAGTVLEPVQITAVLEAGASFAVSPGLNPRVLAAAREVGLPFAPGVVTPSDIEAALEQGCKLMKFFPAEPSGGLPYLRSMAAPFAHLGVRYIPLGGLSAKNLSDYASDPLVAAIGGSWLAPKQLVTSAAWDEISALAREAIAIIQQARQ